MHNELTFHFMWLLGPVDFDIPSYSRHISLGLYYHQPPIAMIAFLLSLMAICTELPVVIQIRYTTRFVAFRDISNTR